MKALAIGVIQISAAEEALPSYTAVAGSDCYEDPRIQKWPKVNGQERAEQNHRKNAVANGGGVQSHPAANITPAICNVVYYFFHYYSVGEVVKVGDAGLPG